jgi:dethiobiotin synthetase
MSNSPSGLFVTATDTGVGKTYVAAMIARALRDAGYRVGVYKPLASGCRWEGGKLLSDDALALWEAAGKPGTLEEVCPQCFESPLAPYLAARREGRRIDSDLIRGQFQAWRDRSDLVIVEGAGGLMSPMTESACNAHLAAEFGLPLIVVAANRLGVIHQVLATLAAASGFEPPLAVAGVLLNCLPGPIDPSAESNRQELSAWIKPPILATVPPDATAFQEPIDWARLSRLEQ